VRQIDKRDANAFNSGLETRKTDVTAHVIHDQLMEQTWCTFKGYMDFKMEK